GAAPVLLRVLDGVGLGAGDSPAGRSTSLPYGNVLDLQKSDALDTQLVLLSRVQPAIYTIEATATAGGTFDLGVVVTQPAGGLSQLRFSQVALQAGAVARIVVD